MNREQLNQRIDTVCKEFEGQGDDLVYVVGMMRTGELFGWRALRICSLRRHWSLANNLFGDLKLIFDEEGPLSKKSVGLSIVKKGEDFWRLVRNQSVGGRSIPKSERVQLEPL
jgi:hypothetical protein